MTGGPGIAGKVGAILGGCQRGVVRRYRMMQLRQQIDVETGGLVRPEYRISWSDDIGAPHDVHFVWEGAKVRILVSPWFDHWSVFWLFKDKISTLLYWFGQAGPDVHRMTASATDGDRFSLGRFSFSSNQHQVVPVPDSHFFMQHGYWHFDRVANLAGRRWQDRNDRIVWRGTMTGNGYATARAGLSHNPAVPQRLRLAAIAGQHGLDFGFVSKPAEDPNHQELRHAGYLAASLAPESWAARKFALDIDGFTNAWSNLLTRMKLGCCVLKVDSQFGYRQWYYDRLRPYEHFVPVAKDLSDLGKQLEWLRSHDKQAQDIALAGQEIARNMTFDTETAAAAKLIRNNWTE